MVHWLWLIVAAMVGGFIGFTTMALFVASTINDYEYENWVSDDCG